MIVHFIDYTCVLSNTFIFAYHLYMYSRSCTLPSDCIRLSQNKRLLTDGATSKQSEVLATQRSQMEHSAITKKQWLLRLYTLSHCNEVALASRQIPFYVLHRYFQLNEFLEKL